MDGCKCEMCLLSSANRRQAEMIKELQVARDSLASRLAALEQTSLPVLAWHRWQRWSERWARA